LSKKVEQSEKFIDFLVKDVYNGKTIVYSNWQVGYRKSNAIIIENKELIPEQFKELETKIIEKIPLKAIGDFIKNGGEVP